MFAQIIIIIVVFCECSKIFLTCASSSNVLFHDWQLARMTYASKVVLFFVFSINIYFIMSHFMTTIIFNFFEYILMPIIILMQETANY
jgi:hypothetical protein